MAEFDRAAAVGSHTLSDVRYAYQPSSELEAEAQAHILSGGSSHVLGGVSRVSSNDSIEERRRRVLEATMNRLKKEEEELEHNCGTAGSSQ